jgi:histidine triad (HIT) family protein
VGRGEPDPECVFCGIVAGSIPSWTVYEDDHTMAFMDINPATDGHTLVIAKRHWPDLFEVDDEDAEAMWRTVRKVATAVRSAFEANGLNLLQANGRVAFQTVFHVHVHVIPRYRIDELRLPWIPRVGDRSKIAELGEKLREALSAD